MGGEVIIVESRRRAARGIAHASSPRTVEAAERSCRRRAVVAAPSSTSTRSSTAPFASVVVEIEGGTGLVEQRAIHPAGDSVAPCANDTSTEWYFADGFTVDGSVETLILTNPYDDTASVDLTFATLAGESTPAAFQGFTVPPRSVRTIPIAELGARDEPVIAVEVAAERGRLVVGRAQHLPRWRAARLRRHARGAGAARPVLVRRRRVGRGRHRDVRDLQPHRHRRAGRRRLPRPAARRRTTVTPRRSRCRPTASWSSTRPTSRVAGPFPTGVTPSVFSTSSHRRWSSSASSPDRPVTRSPRRWCSAHRRGGDGYVASRWHVGIGPSEPTPQALVVYNVDNVDGTITIESVGPAGPTDVASV